MFSERRKGNNISDDLIIACNMTPVPRESYRMGLPRKGRLNKIAFQIKKGIPLTLKEQSLLAFHTSEIEDILQNELSNY